MSKHTISAVFFSIVAGLGLTLTAQAGSIDSNIGSYDSPLGYDYVNSLPPTGNQLIGTFTFALPVGESAAGVTISGSFGNGDSDTTALSDYYLGDATDGESAVEVAACDDPTNDCAADDGGPTSWSLTLTQPEIADLATGLADGSLDFTYTWDSSPPAEGISGFDQYVYAGAATLAIVPTPEPATVLFCFGGLAGLAAFRRFRKL